MLNPSQTVRLFRIFPVSILKHVTERKSTAREGVWVLLGQSCSALASLVGVRLLTEFITPEVFGGVSLLLGLAMLGSNLACAPLLQAALRFYPDMCNAGQAPILRRAITRLLSRATFLLLVVVVGGGGLHSFFTGSSWWEYIALAAVMLVDVARGLEMNLLAAARRQKAYALWSAWEACARPIAAIAAISFWKVSPDVVLWGYCFASLLGYLGFRMLSRPEGADFAGPEGSSLVSEIWVYALPLVPLAVVGWISSLSDRFLIGGVLGLEQVGIYAAAYGLVSRPFLILGNIICLTLRPMFFEAITRHDSGAEKRVFSLWLRLSIVGSIFGVICFALLKVSVASLLLAAPYQSAAGLMPWIALGYCFYVLAIVHEQVIYAYKRTALLLRMHTCVAAVSLLTGGLGAFYLGLFGAALACPAYFLCHLILAIVYAKAGRTLALKAQP
ncbi:MAG: hypothetical protein JWM16_935 [Verrucomicrobiales bacterium]|nr:hypothetical protein [Verrucomicrobiales bacterium]